MLRIESGTIVEERAEIVPAPARAVAAALPMPSAYQASRQFDGIAAVGSAAIVAALLAGFVWMRVAPTIGLKHNLLVLDLHAAPPPPPHIVPTPRPRVEPQKIHPITAPPPIVTIAAPSPVATAPTPMPPVIAAPPAPPSAPVALAKPAPAPAMPADGGDLSSKMISAKPPAYPLESRRKKEEGVVVLTVLLDTEGRVSDIAVAQSSGSERLDKAALGAVRGWRWSPVMRNGAAVMVQGRVRIPFVLKR
jgi:periplasmic protein TonB